MHSACRAGRFMTKMVIVLRIIFKRRHSGHPQLCLDEQLALRCAITIFVATGLLSRNGCSEGKCFSRFCLSCCWCCGRSALASVAGFLMTTGPMESWFLIGQMHVWKHICDCLQLLAQADEGDRCNWSSKAQQQ